MRCRDDLRCSKGRICKKKTSSSFLHRHTLLLHSVNSLLLFYSDIVHDTLRPAPQTLGASFFTLLLLQTICAKRVGKNAKAVLGFEIVGAAVLVSQLKQKLAVHLFGESLLFFPQCHSSRTTILFCLEYHVESHTKCAAFSAWQFHVERQPCKVF